MMQWILSVPDITHGISFSYDIISFLLLITALILSLLVCMCGYKIIRTAFAVGASLAFGLLGFRISDNVTSELTFKLVFFVSFIFIGLALLQMVFMLLNILVKALKLERPLRKIGFWATALLGAGTFSALVYFWVLRNPLIAGGVAVTLAVVGTIVQYRNKQNEIPAHTYDDLFHMPRRPEPDEVPQG